LRFFAIESAEKNTVLHRKNVIFPKKSYFFEKKRKKNVFPLDY